MKFKDHFSSHAAHYRQARPLYPAQLFDALAGITPAHDLVWDAGCGNGQASVALARYYASVYASDPSATQIANALEHERVRYEVAAAEQCGLPDACADLVTVAQALHWFDVPRFHLEARRVLKRNGVIAEWGYAECRVSPAVDEVCLSLYAGLLGAYWPPERAHVEDEYATLEFPFERLTLPEMDLCADWNLPQYLDYLASWSALQRFRKERSSDPLTMLGEEFERAWGDDPERVREVRWRLFVRAGRKPM